MAEGAFWGSGLVRGARVGAGALGLGARLAGARYLGLPGPGADGLAAALGGLKGPVMKIGQMLATIPEALPPAYATALAQLQSSAPPMGRAFVRRRMRAELGEGWRGRFAAFEEDAAAAASLGQVHRARGHDGRALACKLQYPDMRAALDSDLGQLRALFGLYERFDAAIKTADIHAEIAARLGEELDYTREAAATRLYAHMLAGEDGAHVPEVVGELSTGRLLTATWLEGRHILDFKDAPAEQRARIALALFRAWYVPFYRYGVIHGDPHLGNYTVREDNTLNLLDFGCVRVFPPAFVGGVIDLYRALREGDEALAVHAYETWGFSGLTRAHIEALTIWARFLYAPLLEDCARPIGEARGGVYGRETALEVHRRLREIGGVSVPQAFVFMDRAALGLGSVFIHLGAEVNWHRAFEGLIDGFDAEALAARQGTALARFGLQG
jgi:predicted unusual protein kinase regulating ubiquinone biosynthesis (AarF/ABC1/UbiB family)